MAFVQFSKVSIAFGDKDILKDVSVNLKTGTKAALAGANGAGKSTLIKIMAGIVSPDSGERTAQKETRIAYLPQSGLTHSGRTLREEADSAFQFGYDIEAKADAIAAELAKSPKNYQSLLESHTELLAKLEESNWYRRASRAESVLLGLGFSKEDLGRQTEEFSGGWQMRIALAKALMQDPDILLLDEPTNYLDIEARTWLEQFLQNYRGGFLLVSHDRYFLDVTINEVYELFCGSLRRYPGNFTHYETVRAEELKSLVAKYEQQQQEIEHIESFIKRFGAKATKASQAQERQKMLDKIVRIEIPESLKKIHFTFPPSPHCGRTVLRAEALSKTYDHKRNVIDNLDLLLEKGERLVVAGRNGSGKSTLLRILAGADTNYIGSVTKGTGVQTGYFSQDSAETISGAQSVVDFIESQSPFELVPKARDMLGAFLFRGDDVFKSLDVLSGGEKSRLALLQLLLHPVNLLVLDEPTNHLDMYSKDVLMDALKDFGGTVVFVSHDRYFIEGLATRVLELSHSHYRNFIGGYADYQERIAKEAEINAAALNATEKESDVHSVEWQNQGQLSWEDEKKRKASRRKKERDVELIEKEIERVEKEKHDMECRLSDPAVYSDGVMSCKIQKQIETLLASLELLNKQWETAMEALE